MKMAGCISGRRSKFLAGLVSVSLALLSAAFLAPAKNATGKVTAVRFWSLGDVTRVAVEVSSEFEYHSEHLSNPERLFFDIRGAKPEMAAKGVRTIPVTDPILKQIRVAETQPGVTRVVLDLEQHAEFTASQLSNPDRLMIELRGKDRPHPPAPSPNVTGASVTGTNLKEPGFTGSSATSARNPIDPPLLTAPARSASIDTAATVTEAKPEPKKFVPPPHVEKSVESARADVSPELLSPPAMPVLAKPVKPPAVPGSVIPRDVAIPASAATVNTEKSLPKTEKSAPAADPLPAKRNTSGDRSLTRVLGLKLGRVVIDPGHGGHDVGTHGPSGLLEKDVTLDIARRLGALIEERLGSEVIFTRSNDTYVALEERTRIANEHKADLFLSIHANSSPLKIVAGVETYYLNFTTVKSALDVAARENASSERSIYELKDLLQKIALKDKIDESREFAARLQNSLYSVSSKGNAAAKNRGVKKAPFVVLIGASMPSVLAEIGFLTNSGDETLLRKLEHRQKIAEALYKGIASYAETLSHFQVAQKHD